jgi:cytoskeleton protein RodZ
MNEISELTVSVLAPVQAPMAGQMIREARLASGLHIGTLSMALKVSVKKLEALEADDWTQLPDVVFVRALATSVCRQIKTDPTPILAALPQTAAHLVLDDGEKTSLNQPFKVSTDAEFTWSKVPMSMPMVVGAVVLLLAATVLTLLPSLSQKVETVQVNPPTVIAPTAVPIFPPEQSPVTPAAVKPLPAVSSPVTTTSSASSSVASAPAVAPLASAPMTASPILRIEAKGVVWIEVRDSKGGALVQRTLQPKEAVSVSGQPPLAVVVGRINEIASVTVRGKSFSLDGMSPDNVARFEVK